LHAQWRTAPRRAARQFAPAPLALTPPDGFAQAAAKSLAAACPPQKPQSQPREQSRSILAQSAATHPSALALTLSAALAVALTACESRAPLA
jgi:hypothetical protein